MDNVNKEKLAALERRLEAYYKAEEKILKSQSFSIGSNQVTRTSLASVQAKIKELETYKNRNGRNVHSDLLLARGKRVFAETTGLNRQHIGELLRQYESAFADGDRENGVRLQKMLEDFLEQFEK